MGFGKDNTGQIIYAAPGTFNLGTLASFDVLGSNIIDFSGAQQDFRILRGEIMAGWRLQTVGEGPVIWGFADAALTDAEVEEAMESGYNNPDESQIEGKQAMRPVWPLGIIDPTTSNGVQNNGNMVVWKPRWTFQSGVRLFFYNTDTAALSGGMLFTVFFKLFGLWVR